MENKEAIARAMLKIFKKLDEFADETTSASAMTELVRSELAELCQLTPRLSSNNVKDLLFSELSKVRAVVAARMSYKDAYGEDEGWPLMRICCCWFLIQHLDGMN